MRCGQLLVSNQLEAQELACQHIASQPITLYLTIDPSHPRVIQTWVIIEVLLLIKQAIAKKNVIFNIIFLNKTSHQTYFQKSQTNYDWKLMEYFFRAGVSWHFLFITLSKDTSIRCKVLESSPKFFFVFCRLSCLLWLSCHRCNQYDVFAFIKKS